MEPLAARPGALPGEKGDGCGGGLRPLTLALITVAIGDPAGFIAARFQMIPFEDRKTSGTILHRLAGMGFFGRFIFRNTCKLTLRRQTLSSGGQTQGY
jgi:hypothetical protein